MSGDSAGRVGQWTISYRGMQQELPVKLLIVKYILGSD